MASSDFIRFVFRIYTFSCGTVLAPSKLSSSCRYDYPYVNSFFTVIVTTYFMNQPSAIHAVDRAYLCRFEVVIFQAIQNIVFQNIVFQIHYLCHRPMANRMKTSIAQQQNIVATPSVNHKKQAQCRHAIPSKAYEKLFWLIYLTFILEFQQAISTCGKYCKNNQT